MRTRFLVCFTGIDGGGKTTQAKALYHELRARGVPCQYVWNRFEPWLVALPWKVIRGVFLPRHEGYVRYLQAKRRLLRNRLLPRLFLYSLLLDCWIQTQLKVRLPLVAGKTVICDRYFYDTLVDISVDLGSSWSHSRALLYNFQRFIPQPNVTFLLDLPAAEALSRKADTPSLEYLMERRRLFLKLAGEIDATVVNAREKTEEVRSTILSHLEDLAQT